MLDILLINPPYSFTNLVRLREKKGKRGFYLNYPHLGLGYLASSALDAGYSAEIIDASADMVDEAEIVREIRKKKPKVIGITVTIQTSRLVYKLVKRIKKIKGDYIVIVGGPHISALPQSVGWMGLKYGMVGEGERGLVKFLDFFLRKKGSIQNIDGLVVYSHGKTAVNRNTPITDLNSLPYPARNLMRGDNYFSPVVGGRITSLITSRGCPFNCTYCSRPAIGLVWRFRSPENVVKEMKETVDKYGVSYIEFVDDTFTIDRKRIEKLCKLIQKEKLRVAWGGQTRANLVDYKLLRQMKKAGCKKLSFGLESGVEKVRYSLNKYVPNESYRKAVAWCRKLGIETNLFVMFGHPGETIADMKKSIEMTLELDPDYAAFYITGVFPGSILAERYLVEKGLTPLIWKKYMDSANPLPAYIPDGLTINDLEKIHKEAFRRFYLRPSYFIRRIKKIDSFSYLLNTIRSGLAIVDSYVVKLEL